MKMGLSHFDFDLLRIWIVPKAKYFALWVFMFSFREGQAGWVLFSITLNDKSNLPFRFQRCRLIITIFNHDIRFGEISVSEMDEICGVEQ